MNHWYIQRVRYTETGYELRHTVKVADRRAARLTGRRESCTPGIDFVRVFYVRPGLTRVIATFYVDGVEVDSVKAPDESKAANG